MSWKNNLRRWCEGISCRALGRRTELTHRTIRNLLAGKGTMHSLKRLVEVGLGRSIDQVFEE